jgi:hypothetical protein
MEGDENEKKEKIKVLDLSQTFLIESQVLTTLGK